VAVALAVLYFVWGSTYLGIKLAVVSFPPYHMLAMRFGAAALLLAGFLKLRGSPWPALKELLGSALVGVLLLVGGLGSVAWAESLGAPSGLAAVMVATMPLWLSLFVGLAGERTGPREVAAMLLGLGGVVLLSRGGELGMHPLAFLLLLMGPVMWAFGSALSRRLPHVQGAMGSAVQMAAAALLLVPLGVLRGERWAHAPSLASVAALAYLALFGSLLAFSAYVFLLNERVRPALLSSYAYVNPVVAVFLGVLLGGERVGPAELAGTAVVLVSVVLVIASPRSTRA
jgi:drug/metabolite transporter (DMT)-like permease